MDSLKTMKEQLISLVQGQLGDVAHADAKELGEAIDMIKDLAEASYYCTITEAMHESEKEGKYSKHHYEEYPDRYEDMYSRGRMYYSHRDYRGGDEGYRDHDYYGDRYRDYEYPRDITRRDPREGRSPAMRKMYMESQEMHHDTAKKMQELEKYMQELTTDIVEMVSGATPEEKQMLRNKIATLSSKIV